MSLTLDTLARQWQTLRLIPRHPRKISSRELTERLLAQGYKVTKRTVERDLQAMSATFPLVVDSRATPYGWSWQKGAQALDVPALSPPEALSFLMVRQFLQPLVPASMLDQLAPYFGMAEQCLDALPASGKGRHPRDWLNKVAVVQPNQPLLPATIDSDVQAHLQEALLRDLQVNIRYRRRGETTDTEYQAHPLGLVQRGSVLYLVCTLFDYQDIRLLTLHRMRKVDILDLAAKAPKGFRLADYIAAGHLGFGSGKPIKLHLRFHNGAGDHLWDTPLSSDQVITELPNGELEVKATVAEGPQLEWWILAFGENVQVIEPANLQEEIGSRLKAAAGFY